MWMYDFRLFYRAAQAVLAGVSPYTVADFNPPLPLALAFVPFTWLPLPWAYASFLLLNLILLVHIAGWKRALWAVLSFPVWFNLFVGQVDLLLALATARWGWRALPLVTLLKPQIAFALAPWYVRRMSPRHWMQAGAIVMVGLSISLLIRPAWLGEWWDATPSAMGYAVRDSNMLWLVPQAYKGWLMPMAAVLGWSLAWHATTRRAAWAWAHLFAPLTNVYSASILAEWIGPWETIVSWLVVLPTVYWVGDIHHGAPLFVVALLVLLRDRNGDGLEAPRTLLQLSLSP